MRSSPAEKRIVRHQALRLVPAIAFHAAQPELPRRDWVFSSKHFSLRPLFFWFARGHFSIPHARYNPARAGRTKPALPTCRRPGFPATTHPKTAPAGCRYPRLPFARRRIGAAAEIVSASGTWGGLGVRVFCVRPPGASFCGRRRDGQDRHRRTRAQLRASCFGLFTWWYAFSRRGARICR